jgi:hypothetical protein
MPLIWNVSKGTISTSLFKSKSIDLADDYMIDAQKKNEDW